MAPLLFSPFGDVKGERLGKQILWSKLSLRKKTFRSLQADEVRQTEAHLMQRYVGKYHMKITQQTIPMQFVA